MSYTPTIVIKKQDLDKHKKLLDDWYPNEEEQKTMEYLKFVNDKHDVVKIDNVEIVLCCPEFSSLNSDVRTKLTELGVQYGLSN